MVAYPRFIKFLFPFGGKTQDYVLLSDAKPLQITPANTLIAFDLHDVIFQKSPTQILRELLAMRKKGTIVKVMLNPYFWNYIRKLKKQTNVAEDLFRRLVLKYPQITGFEAEFIKLSNAQKLKPKTVSLIKRLKDRGYQLFVLSNIAERTFDELKDKFPELFSYFDDALVVSADDNYLHKPHPAYYDKFKMKLQTLGYSDKHILFIDDLKHNIQAAAEAGMSGIQFKSAKRLEKIFKELALL